MVAHTGTSTWEAETKRLRVWLAWLHGKMVSQNATQQSSLNSQQQDLFVSVTVSLEVMESCHLPMWPPSVS